MKIELKNFKFYDKLSEETLCFTANIWVNGTKCGSAENRGYGGCASYHHEGTASSKERIAEAEGYCKSNGTTLWDYLDELACKLVAVKEKEALAKKLNKEMQKAILIGIDDGNKIEYQVISFKLPLREMWENYPDHFKLTLNNKLEKYASKGYKLLNTNIPQQFLN